jgi:hypothetical protein
VVGHGLLLGGAVSLAIVWPGCFTFPSCGVFFSPWSLVAGFSFVSSCVTPRVELASVALAPVLVLPECRLASHRFCRRAWTHAEVDVLGVELLDVGDLRRVARVCL